MSPVNVPTPDRTFFLTFTLIYTVNNTIVAQLVNGMVLDISAYPSSNFNIRVDTINSSVKSVLFLQSNQVEVSKPWAYCGNVGELYNTCSAFRKAGTFNVTVRLYSDAFPQSMVVSNETITFTLVRTSPPNVPISAPQITPVKLPSAPVTLPSVPVMTPPVPVLTPPVPVLTPPVPLIFPPVPVIVPPVNVPTPDRTFFLTFTLIYSGNNTIAAQLVNGMVIDVSAYPSSNFNIRVDTINASVKSVLFLKNNQVEVSKPWAYCGNVGELYNTCADFSSEGTFNVTVRLYSDAYPQSVVVSDESITFTLVGKPSSTPPLDKFPILINAGGPTVVDSENRTWIADSYFTGGNTYSNSQIDLINTDNDIIYQSERFGNFIYEIPIPRASYSVVLHFAEI